LIPPSVAKVVSRGSHPTIRSFSFLNNLWLKMVLFLGHEDYSEKIARNDLVH
jgi:hypothetical protein